MALTSHRTNVRLQATLRRVKLSGVRPGGVRHDPQGSWVEMSMSNLDNFKDVTAAVDASCWLCMAIFD